MATMQDVATRAKVALSTVSYALSGARPVAPATLERIRTAMDELDYHPNAMARGLASRRSRVLAMTFPSFDNAMGETVFEIVTGAQRRAAELGYRLSVWPLDAARAGEQLVDLVRQGLADGVLLVEVAVDDARVTALVSGGAPFVTVGRTEHPEGQAFVDIDFDAAIEDAVAELHRLGHRRIAFVGRPAAQEASGYGPAVRSHRAYEAAMAARGLTALATACDASPGAGRDMARWIAHQAERPTGVVVMNDMAAIGLLPGLRELGLEVPRDVSVVGAVSSRTLGSMTQPMLTTSHGPGEHMGELAVTALVGLLDGTRRPGDVHTLVSCDVVDGESLGPAPALPGADGEPGPASAATGAARA